MEKNHLKIDCKIDYLTQGHSEEFLKRKNEQDNYPVDNTKRNMITAKHEGNDIYS